MTERRSTEDRGERGTLAEGKRSQSREIKIQRLRERDTKFAIWRFLYGFTFKYVTRYSRLAKKIKQKPKRTKKKEEKREKKQNKK